MRYDAPKTADERLLQLPADDAFRHTDPWRVMRIQSEFVRGFDALAEVDRAVTVFGSARFTRDNPYYQAAVETSRLLGEAGFAIITGGGPGIMQAGNEGAQLAGALSVGLNIELPFEQEINPHCDIGVEFRYFFVRKTMLVKYSEAFVIFPGGFGTLDELTEALTLIQTGKVHDFPVVLFGTKYWRGFLDWLRNTVLEQRCVSPPDLELMMLADTPEQARDQILAALTGESDQARRESAAVAQAAHAYQPKT